MLSRSGLFLSALKTGIVFFLLQALKYKGFLSLAVTIPLCTQALQLLV